MTAEPLPDREPGEDLPAWFYPPRPSGWIADDLDRLPPSAPRFELIDGALVMMSPQTDFHGTVMRRLANAMEDRVPGHLRVRTEMTIKLGKRQRPEPDILVINVQPKADRTAYLPGEVSLVVEIVSEESAERDRIAKPLKYAKAGIKHFWRVESEDDQPVVHVFELEEPMGAYVPTGIYHDRLKVSVPYAMDIDLTTLYRK